MQKARDAIQHSRFRTSVPLTAEDEPAVRLIQSQLRHRILSTQHEIDLLVRIREQLMNDYNAATDNLDNYMSRLSAEAPK